MFDLETVRDVETLHTLKDEWNALVESSPNRDVVHSHQWYDCWARHFLSDDGMCVVAARDSRRLVALMPLMKSRFSKKGLGVSAIRSMTNRYSPVFDLISSESPEDALRAMIPYVFRISDTHMMILDKVPKSSVVLDCIDEACRAEGLQYLVRGTDGNCTIHVEGTFEEYFDGLKGKFKKNVRAAERKALERGSLTLVKPGGEDDLLDIMERGFAIEESSWKGDRGVAVNRGRTDRGFFFELGRDLFEAGWLRVALLVNNDEDVSFYFCVQNFNVIHALVIGASPDHGSIGPGIILTKRMLEEVFADTRSGSWKFGGGLSRWKRDFSKGQAEDYFKVFVFRDSIRGRALHLVAETYDRNRPSSPTNV